MSKKPQSVPAPVVRLAVAMLAHDEGRRTFAYNDKTGARHVSPRGKLTIGVGWNLEDRGLPDEIIDRLTEIGLRDAAADLDALVGSWRNASVGRQAALLNWAFQMGQPGMATFVRTLPLLRAGKWDEAGANLKRSKWATVDSPARAARVIRQIMTGDLSPDYPGEVRAAFAAATRTAAR